MSDDCPCCGEPGEIEVIQARGRFLLCHGCHDDMVAEEVEAVEASREFRHLV